MALRGQKRALDLLELELQVVVGTSPRFWESNSDPLQMVWVLNHWATHQSHHLPLLSTAQTLVSPQWPGPSQINWHNSQIKTTPLPSPSMSTGQPRQSLIETLSPGDYATLTTRINWLGVEGRGYLANENVWESDWQGLQRTGNVLSILGMFRSCVWTGFSVNPRLAWNSLQSRGWLQTCSPSASAFLVLELQVCFQDCLI